MTRPSLLYAVFVTAALAAGIGVPLAVHRGGSDAVDGWQGLVNPGPLSPAHRSLAQSCESCHTPHKGVEAKNCVACHAGTEFGDKASTRFHAAAADCTVCHVEHDGGASLTRMNHAVLKKPGMWKGPIPQSVRSGRGNGDPLAVLDCASCHSTRDPHQSFFGAQCSSCHVLTSWRISGFRHPPPSSRECAECHKPAKSHLMGHFKMVSQKVAGEKARVDQCYACHTTDSWNNIAGKGFYDHH